MGVVQLVQMYCAILVFLDCELQVDGGIAWIEMIMVRRDFERFDVTMILSICLTRSWLFVNNVIDDV